MRSENLIKLLYFKHLQHSLKPYLKTLIRYILKNKDKFQKDLKQKPDFTSSEVAIKICTAADREESHCDFRYPQ